MGPKLISITISQKVMDGFTQNMVDSLGVPLGRIQVLEEGNVFESLILRLDRCCFLDILRVYTHLLQTFWNTLRLPSVELAFQEQKTSCFRATAAPHDLVYHGWVRRRV